MPLDGVEIETVRAGPNKTLQSALRISHASFGTRSLLLCAHDDTERDRWVDALTQSSTVTYAKLAQISIESEQLKKTTHEAQLKAANASAALARKQEELAAKLEELTLANQRIKELEAALARNELKLGSLLAGQDGRQRTPSIVGTMTTGSPRATSGKAFSPAGFPKSPSTASLVDAASPAANSTTVPPPPPAAAPATDHTGINETGTKPLPPPPSTSSSLPPPPPGATVGLPPPPPTNASNLPPPPSVQQQTLPPPPPVFNEL